jgi:hypothetical protein
MIAIPFLPEFQDRLATGRKIATSRTKRYGRAGQRFTALGMIFKLTAVKKCPLRWVADLMYREEGFETPAQFKSIWTRLHPKRGYRETDEIYLHVFERQPCAPAAFLEKWGKGVRPPIAVSAGEVVEPDMAADLAALLAAREAAVREQIEKDVMHHIGGIATTHKWFPLEAVLAAIRGV